MSDPVSAPAHYTGPIECKDAMKAMMGNYCHQGHAMENFWWGCAFKYLWRWPYKNGVEDLRKCQQCIDFLIEVVDE